MPDVQDIVDQPPAQQNSLTAPSERGPISESVAKLLRSDFVSKVAETLATKGAVFCFSLVLSIIVARLLGPGGRGVYATALALTGMGVQFGNFGLHASNTFLVAKEKQLLGVLVANALAVSAFVGLALGLLIGTVMLLLPSVSPLHGIELALALIGIPFGIAYLLLQNLLLGLYKIRSFNWIEILSRSVNVSLVVVIASLVTITSRLAISASIAATAISGFMCLVVLSSEFRPVMPSWRVFVKAFAYGCRPYLTAVFGFAVLKADLIIVARLLGAEQTGFYSVAVNLSDMIYVLPVTVGSILFPKLSRMPESREKWTQTKRVALFVSVGMVVICAAAWGFSRYAIPLLFGERFAASIAPFKWLLPGIGCMSVTSVLSAYIASERIPWAVVWVYVAMSVVDIVLNLLWLPGMGIIGTAKLSSFCYLGCLTGVGFVARGIARETR